MSEQPPSKPPAPRPRRDPILTVLMICAGAILLFPGICSLYFLHDELGVPGDGNEGVLTGIVDIWVAIALLMGIGGVAFIVRAIWR